MKVGLVFLGVLVWTAVGALSVGMAVWDEPVWGFFPILIAVAFAWAVGEYLTASYLTREDGR